LRKVREINPCVVGRAEGDANTEKTSTFTGRAESLDTLALNKTFGSSWDIRAILGRKDLVIGFGCHACYRNYDNGGENQPATTYPDK
jgi:hypothetical protein